MQLVSMHLYTNTSKKKISIQIYKYTIQIHLKKNINFIICLTQFRHIKMYLQGILSIDRKIYIYFFLPGTVYELLVLHTPFSIENMLWYTFITYVNFVEL